MKKLLIGSLTALSLAAGCGGKTVVTADDINGVNVKDAKIAVFEERQINALADFDGDGTNDSLDIFIGLVSDDETICNDVIANTQLTDVELSVVEGIKFFSGAATATAFANGDTLTGDGNFNAAAASIEVIQGGATKADAFSDGKGTLTVTKIDAAKAFTGNITDVLNLDFACEDPNSGVTCDTELDQFTCTTDGAPCTVDADCATAGDTCDDPFPGADATTINNNVTVDMAKAAPCAGLIQALFGI